MSSPSEAPRSPFRPRERRREPQIALEIRRYLEREGLQPGDRIGTEQELAAEFGVSRPTLREGLRLLASSHLIRVGRGRAGGIFVARTPSEGMSRNVSESISMMLATESVSLAELLDARMFLEVPLAGLAAANASEDTAARAAGGDRRGRGPRARHPAVQRRRQALPPDPRRAPRATSCCCAFTDWILEVLQPQLIATSPTRVDGERDPASAPGHPARGPPPPARGGRAGDARAHRLPARRSRAQRLVVRRELPLVDRARRRPARA